MHMYKGDGKARGILEIQVSRLETKRHGSESCTTYLVSCLLNSDLRLTDGGFGVFQLLGYLHGQNRGTFPRDFGKHPERISVSGNIGLGFLKNS